MQIRARRERLRRALVRGALQAPPRLKFSKFRDTRTAAEATRKRRATSRWGEYTRIADRRVGGRPKPTGRGIARFRGPGARSASCSVSVRATGPEVAAALCRRRTRCPPRPRLSVLRLGLPFRTTPLGTVVQARPSKRRVFAASSPPVPPITARPPSALPSPPPRHPVRSSPEGIPPLSLFLRR